MQWEGWLSVLIGVVLDCRSRDKGPAPMPIRKYIAGATFDPDTVARMNAAFEKACMALNVGGSDPLADTVAKKLVSLASQGVTDLNEMWQRVVAEVDLGPR